MKCCSIILNIWLESFTEMELRFLSLDLQNKGDKYNESMKPEDTALSGKTVG